MIGARQAWFIDVDDDGRSKFNDRRLKIFATATICSISEIKSCRRDLIILDRSPVCRWPSRRFNAKRDTAAASPLAWRRRKSGAEVSLA